MSIQYVQRMYCTVQMVRNLIGEDNCNDTTTTTNEEINYTIGIILFELDKLKTTAITSITGTVDGISRSFIQDTDYDLYQNKYVRWLSSEAKPDNGTTFYVTYTHYKIDDNMITEWIREASDNIDLWTLASAEYDQTFRYWKTVQEIATLLTCWLMTLRMYEAGSNAAASTTTSNFKFTLGKLSVDPSKSISLSLKASEEITYYMTHAEKKLNLIIKYLRGDQIAPLYSRKVDGDAMPFSWSDEF